MEQNSNYKPIKICSDISGIDSHQVNIIVLIYLASGWVKQRYFTNRYKLE